MTTDMWALAAMIAAGAFAFAGYETARAWFKHRERMAKIERGIDPDQAAQEDAPK